MPASAETLLAEGNVKVLHTKIPKIYSANLFILLRDLQGLIALGWLQIGKYHVGPIDIFAPVTKTILF